MKRAGTEIQCTVRLDRFRVPSWAKRGMPVPKIRGFKTARDIRLRRQGKPLVYARVREMRSNHSATKVFWQHDRQRGWAKRWRITLVADDLRGIAAWEAWSVFKHLRFPRLTLVELAIDFHPSSGVDAEFVRQHALFGKSRFRPDRGGPGQLRFGSRSSGKLVRCYQKNAVNAFRVEVELHSSLLPRPLRDNHLEIIDSRWPEIADAAFSIVPRHFRFVQFRFKALGRHLRRRFGERGDELLEQTRVHSSQSLHEALAYLRRKGIHNPHRFLQPMKQLNTAVEQAIDEWAADFLRQCRELDEMQPNTDKPKRREQTFLRGGR